MSRTPDPSLAVFPLRFSSRPAAMIAFLRTLGLAPSLTAGEDSFGDLHAGAGRVMVHSAASTASGAAHGDTDLCLIVPDALAAAKQLEAEGLEVAVWDESYGKQGVITGPAGEAIGLNEDQEDSYGYQEHDPAGADARLSVVAVLASDDFARDAAFFARLGFVPEGTADEHWQALRGPGRSGIIGLHAPGPDARRTRPGDGQFGPSLQVRLGFQTSEDLAQLAARLQSAGYDAQVRGPQGARAVHLTDPDGSHVEIHAAPQG